MEQKRKPHLRVAVTPECNFDCVYCRAGGEGLPSNGELMSSREIIEVVRIASEIGFRYLKITGGEPTLRRDLFRIIEGCSKLENLEEIQLATNASRLTKEYVEGLKMTSLDSITISLDAASREKFKEITKRDRFEKVISGICTAREVGFPVTINSVIMQRNKGEVEGLIDIARKTGSRIKLLDYIKVNDNGWEVEYLPFDQLRKDLETRAEGVAWMCPPGGLGTPMPVYKINGTEVIVKDASIGTNYHETCNSCRNYPCQDALISLRVTHDGKLKRCLIRDDSLVDVLNPLRSGNKEEVRKLIAESYRIFEETKYQPNAWNHENEKHRIAQ